MSQVVSPNEVGSQKPSQPKNDSVEKGVYLTIWDRKVHACKVREDIGAGITRCGFRFLIGDTFYKADGEFGRPAQKEDTAWVKCESCLSSTDYISVKAKWVNWKSVVRRTLKLIGAVTSK